MDADLLTGMVRDVRDGGRRDLEAEREGLGLDLSVRQRYVLALSSREADVSLVGESAESAKSPKRSMCASFPLAVAVADMASRGDA